MNKDNLYELWEYTCLVSLSVRIKVFCVDNCKNRLMVHCCSLEFSGSRVPWGQCWSIFFRRAKRTSLCLEWENRFKSQVISLLKCNSLLEHGCHYCYNLSMQRQTIHKICVCAECGFTTVGWTTLFSSATNLLLTKSVLARGRGPKSRWPGGIPRFPHLWERPAVHTLGSLCAIRGGACSKSIHAP